MPSSRDRFDDFFDDDEDSDVVDTRPDGRLLKVPLARIAPNAVNPRSYFGTDEELQELGSSLRRRQVHALPVVSRGAYLKLWPEHEEKVGSVDVVLVSGERRYRAATTVGLAALQVVIDDTAAMSRQAFLNAVVTENVARENFDPIEEALALEALVEVYGTASAVAEHFDKSSGWVSQRRQLLRLDPKMQIIARRREMPVEAARTLAGLVKKHEWSPEEQSSWWAEQQEARAAAAEAATIRRQQRRSPRSASTPEPVGPSTASVAAPQSPRVFTAVKTEERQGPPVVPPQGAEGRPRPAEPDREPIRATGGQERSAVPVVAPVRQDLAQQAGEPEWAAGKSSPALAAARGIVERFGPDDRKVIVRFLAAVEEVERAAGKTEGIVHKT